MNKEAIEHAVACMRGDPEAIARHYKHEKDGWYYLHTNGELIHKKTEPEQDNGGFVRRVWKLDTSDRQCAWRIILEASALGANLSRLSELCGKWSITYEDLNEYLLREKDVTPERMKGLRRVSDEILKINLDRLFDLASDRNAWPTFEEVSIGKET